MNFQPIRDDVAIQPFEAPEQQGGIFIPQQAKKRPNEGEVVAVGPLSSLEVGQRVLFGAKSGSEVEGVLVVNEADVLAVIG